MDMLHQLFENIKILLDEAKNEKRGRPKKRLVVVLSAMRRQSRQL